MHHRLSKAADSINCRSSFRAAGIVFKYILNNQKYEELGFIDITLLDQIPYYQQSYIEQCIQENRQLTPNQLIIYREHINPTEPPKPFRIPIQKC